jgi:hypothetical protein
MPSVILTKAAGQYDRCIEWQRSNHPPAQPGDGYFLNIPYAKMLKTDHKFMAVALISVYVGLSAGAWLFGGLFLLGAWLMAALVGIYITEQLRTACNISAWDRFWWPVTGTTWGWVVLALVALCTPELFLHIIWKLALLASVLIVPLAFAWWLRAKEKRLLAYSFVALHLLGLLGATQILDRLGVF